MPLPSVLIGGAFVSEQSAELFATVGAERKQFAVIVTDLVAKVPKNSPVRLVHARPQRFSVSIVALRQVKSDDPVLVAGHDLPLTAGEQVECKTDGAVAYLDRELELVEAEDQPALGGLGNPVLRKAHHVTIGWPSPRQRAAEAQAECRGRIRSEERRVGKECRP